MEAGAAAEALPEGWTLGYSRSQKRPYYVNARKNISLWTLQEVHAFIEKDKECMVVSKLPQTLEAMEAEVTAKFKEFMDNKDAVELKFPPCLKDLRFVIIESADDYGLRTESEFIEGKGTFVSAFKEGHSNFEKHLDKVKQHLEEQPQPAPIAKPDKVEEVPPTVDETELKKLGTVKRDRRTIEQIQKDSQTKKQKL